LAASNILPEKRTAEAEASAAHLRQPPRHRLRGFGNSRQASLASCVLDASVRISCACAS
jgi:hypothetical protein